MEQVVDQLPTRAPKHIFDGAQSTDPLSNRYRHPISIATGGKEEIWTTAYHFLLGSSVLREIDRQAIRAAKSAERAEAIAARARIRPDWMMVEPNYLDQVLTRKFSDPEIQQNLLAHPDYVLVDSSDPRNRLGKALMRVRAAMLKEADGQ